MRADLRHQKELLALTLQAFAHPDFGFAAMVFPTVIEEVNAAVDRAVHNCLSRLLVLSIAQMMSAQAKRRDLYASLCRTVGEGFVLSGHA